jgi:tetratricopeptide (TPR) repeat protein
MTLERWQRVDEIFQAAIERHPAERAAFLDKCCADDQELRTEVESLISCDKQGLSFVDEPAFQKAAGLLIVDEPQLRDGQHIGHYEIAGLIGRGGMGEVYGAKDLRLNRRIALKLLPADYSRQKDRLRRFQQEAQAASALNHPNILTIHELGDVDGRQFIATEFVDGETLRERMKRGRLSLPETLDISTQVASALAAAHRAGIVHRDIKPENIMLRRDGYVKVLDFGLAKLTEQREQPPRDDGERADDVDISSGLLMGTVKYMSPEQARCAQVDPRSDIFSLGVVVYEMLSGRAPFKGEDTEHLLSSIAEEEPRPLTEHDSDAPEELQRIVSKALIKNKDKRYQTAEDFLADLKTLKQQLERSTEPQVVTRTKHRMGSTRTGGALTASSVGYIVGQIKEHKAIAWSGLISLVILLAGLGYSLNNWINKRATLPFRERDWVLITSFENRTGEPLFDGTIESALEREVSNSHFVNVVTSERAGDVLRLMKKDQGTKIDLGLGREICLRDGGIRALLAGRVEKLGTSYLMSVSLVDPFRNQTVSSRSEDAANQESLWPTIRRLSNWTRETLGESLPSIQQSGQALEKVTTPSLRALQLYTQAMVFVNDSQSGAAEQVLRQAVTEDAEFASAYIMLAHALNNQRKPAKEWGPPSQRALDLSERTSDRERYFIEGSYYSIRHQFEKTVSAYEALVQQYPDHFWGRNNLAWTYFYLGRWQESVTQFAQAAELRPNDVWINYLAAMSLIHRDLNEARRVVQRAAKFITPETVTSLPAVAWIQLFGVHDLWVRGEVESALSELDHWAQTIDSREGLERASLVTGIGSHYLSFGKLRAAEEAFQRLTAKDETNWLSRNFLLAQVAYAAGDLAKSRKYLITLKPSFPVATLLARVGLTDEAQKMLPEIIKIHHTSPEYNHFCRRIVEGDIALSQGRTTEAISLLGEAIPALRWITTDDFFMASESLADALERQGDLHKAVQVLERASREKTIAYEDIGSTGQYWLRVQCRLLQVYRKLGRIEDAQRLEAELSKILAYADPGHPVLLQLKQARTTSNY